MATRAVQEKVLRQIADCWLERTGIEPMPGSGFVYQSLHNITLADAKESIEALLADGLIEAITHGDFEWYRPTAGGMAVLNLSGPLPEPVLLKPRVQGKKRTVPIWQSNLIKMLGLLGDGQWHALADITRQAELSYQGAHAVTIKLRNERSGLLGIRRDGQQLYIRMTEEGWRWLAEQQTHPEPPSP